MYYIFAVNDFSLGTEIIPGRDIIVTLFAANRWLYSPLAGNLSKLHEGDKVVAYLAGKQNRVFCGTFEIAAPAKERDFEPSGPLESKLSSWLSYSTPIRDVHLWERPLPITGVKDSLSFIKDKKNWGLYFRQSSLRIPKEDYDLIVSEHQRSLG